MMFEKVSVMFVVTLLLAGLVGVVFGSGSDAGERVADGVEERLTSGSGTLDNPYLIYDVNDLQNMKNHLSGHYVLANDIDASETEGWDDGQGFEPVGETPDWPDYGEPFTGSFDGRNHTITGLYINRSDKYFVGLFGCIDSLGVVKNVGLLNNNINGGSGTGGLAGKNDGMVENSFSTGNVNGIEWVGGLMGYHTGTVSYSYVTGNVNGDDVVGGLTGLNERGMVSNSYATGDVTGTWGIGGLVGSSSRGIVSESYATGTVSGGNRVGGLIGNNYHGTLSNSYAAGDVTGGGSVGGLIGYNYRSTVSNSYSTGDVTGGNSLGGLVGYHEGSTLSNSHYNIDDVLINGGHHITLGGLFYEQYHDWFDSGFTLDISDYSDTLVPSGDHYEISGADGLRDLLGFSWNVGYKYRLTADLNLSTTPNLYIPYFAGEFDGNNHTITDMTINQTFASNIGMFGYIGTTESVVKSITLINNNTTGGIRTGGLVGTNRGTVSSIYATGTVSGGSVVGGLVGYNYDGTVENSYAKGNVSGTNSVGGLVGSTSGTVSNSYATGNVNGNDNVGGFVGRNIGMVSNSYANGNVSGDKDVGGLVGYNWGTVSNTYATGNVNGNDSVGGFLGRNSGTVENSYAYGDVSGDDYVGGLVGYNGRQSVVYDSYAVGNTTGNRYVGGLVGYNYYDRCIIINSCATGITTGNETVGGLVGYNEGTVLTSYAMGGTIGNRTAGGLVGENNLYGRIFNSYSNGTVVRKTNSINTDFGGFVGLNDQGRITNSYSIGRVTYDNETDPTDKGFAGNVTTGGNYEMTGNFWDVETSGQESTSGDATGKSTEEMKTESTFTDASWDFKYTWFMDEGVTYPLHYWQIGNGTADNPFLIYDVWDLQDMNMNTYAHYALANDIDAAITSEWNDGAGFLPVGRSSRVYGDISTFFGGSLDGRNRTVSGLYVNRPDTSFIGLLGSTVDRAVVKNIGLSNVNIIGDTEVGGLVGLNEGVVYNSYSTGSITGYEWVGGLVGVINYHSKVENSFSAANVTGVYNIGGLAGLKYGGTIYNSYATGEVSGDWASGGLVGSNVGMVDNSFATGTVSGGSRVGGLVGTNYGTVDNSHATGTVSGNNRVGGIVGDNYSGRVFNSHFNGSVDGHENVGGIAGINVRGDLARISNSHYNIDEVLINGEHHVTRGGIFDEQYQDWFSNNLTLNISDYSSTIIPNGDHYGINSVQGIRDLLGFADDSRYKFRLTADIDLSSAPGLYIPHLGGEFDGNNHTLINLDIDQPFVETIGMFGYIGEGAVVKNVGLLNNKVVGTADVGGLVGFSGWGSTVKNSYTTGNVSGDYRVGGLVGSNRESTVLESYTTGNTSGNYYVGGLVGVNEDGLVTHSYSSGNTTGTYYIGGLVGINYGTFDMFMFYNAMVENSYATGDTTGEEFVGGLVGVNSVGVIFHSYSTGNTMGVDSIGGLVGVNDWAVVDVSYTTGNVIGNRNVGGLVGYNSGARASNSYASGDIAGVENVGGFVGLNYGTVNNSYARGTVTRVSGSVGSFGGFVGLNYQRRIINCYSTGQVTYENADNPTDKGFAGGVDTGGNYEMRGNFWDVETSEQESTSGEATGKTTAEMMGLNTFTVSDWDIMAVETEHDRDRRYIWNIVETETYPFLSWQEVIFHLEFTLEILTEGNGTTDPAIGNHTYNYGQEVVVEAIPDEGWRFSHWSGDVPEGEEENANITIVIDSDKNVIAHFEQIYHNLIISIEGEGTTDPSAGNHSYAYGTQVNLTAFPDEGWYFSHWSGDVTAGNETNANITIAMDGDKNITAHFYEIVPPSVEITSPYDGEEFDTDTVTVEWTAEEGTYPISHFEIRLNDGDWMNVGDRTHHTFEALEDGEYSIAVRAVDNRNNSGEDNVEFYIDMDEEDETTGMGVPIWLLILLLLIVLALVLFIMWKKERGTEDEDEIAPDEDEVELEEDLEPEDADHS